MDLHNASTRSCKERSRSAVAGGQETIEELVSELSPATTTVAAVPEAAIAVSDSEKIDNNSRPVAVTMSRLQTLTSTGALTAVATTIPRTVSAVTPTVHLNSALCVTIRVPVPFCWPIERLGNDEHHYAPVTFACTIIACHYIHAGARPIALVTKEPIGTMPALVLLYKNIQTLPTTATLADGLIMSHEQRQAAYRYTLKVLAFCALKQQYDADQLPYLLLPATQELRIDWNEVMACLEREDVIALAGSSLLASASEESLGALKDRIVYQGTHFWNERPLCPQAFRRQSWISSHGFPPLPEHGVYAKAVSNTPSLPEDQLLLEVLSVPKQSDMRKLNREGVLIRHGFVKPACCYVGSMSASLLRSARMLPSILTAYESILLTRQCNIEVLKGLLNNERLLQEALTTPRADQHFNYQRLEFIGDCILKLIASCVMFSYYGNLNEGGLTQKRTQVISNAHLRRIGIRNKLAEYVNNDLTFPKRWEPHGANEKKAVLSDKMQADIVEAILGAAWLDGGLSAVITCCNLLSIFDKPVSVDTFQRIYGEHGTPSTSSPPQIFAAQQDEGDSKSTILNIEQVLGYTFRRPHLAQQALTHASMPGVPSYERLEFLGDAVLDVCLLQLLDQTYGPQTEEGYTVLKGHALSNISLAVACLSSDLPRLLRHQTAEQMALRFDAFRTRIQHACRASTHLPPERRKMLLWQGIDDAPKQLADILESTIGAVFVDAGFELEAAYAVFNTLFKRHFLAHFHPDVLPLSLMPLVTLETRPKV